MVFLMRCSTLLTVGLLWGQLWLKQENCRSKEFLENLAVSVERKISGNQ